MKLRLILLSVISLALAVGAGWYIYDALQVSSASTSTAAQSPPPSSVQTVNGETVVSISPDAQRASRIEVAPLTAVTSRPSVGAYATVVDLQPLFDLRSRIASARADVDMLTTQSASSREQYARSRTLFADDRNISAKSLQDARSAMQADEAKLQSASATLSGLNGAMRQQFGDALAKAATAPGAKLFARLQSGHAVVVRVTLPGGTDVTPPERIAIDTFDGRSVPAHRLSASPIADPTVQGNPWFYLADAALPASLHTIARVPASTQAVTGVHIPERAVVWYGGQTWAYVQTAPDRFTRRYVPAAGEGEHGFTVTSGFRPGERVVEQGAQLLLSEELKPKGIATACKDPPECDD